MKKDSELLKMSVKELEIESEKYWNYTKKIDKLVEAKEAGWVK